MNHQIVIPADGFPAVFESFLHAHELFCRQHAIRQVAGFVGGRIAVWKAELVAGEPARMRFRLCRPVGNRRFIQHVARRSVIVQAHLVAELSAEQR